MAQPIDNFTRLVGKLDVMKASVPPPRRKLRASAERLSGRPRARGQLTGFMGHVFRWSVAAVLATIALILTDITFGVSLVGPLRPWLPFALVAFFVSALALGVGAYGAPERPGITPVDSVPPE
ncbi:hypothetical protein BH23BAC4_BH23BAC4_09190 [soil metagenome]